MKLFTAEAGIFVEEQCGLVQEAEEQIHQMFGRILDEYLHHHVGFNIQPPNHQEASYGRSGNLRWGAGGLVQGAEDQIHLTFCCILDVYLHHHIGNGDNIVKEDSYNFELHSGNINIVHKFMFGLDQGNNN